MTANKVCPVVLRDRGFAVEILAFEHPVSGRQLVKGSIEAGEAPEAAALRELSEESGITCPRVTRHIGTWVSGFEEQVWTFFLCEPASPLPESWVHHAADDGGHDFRFFWQPLFEPAASSDWHPLFRDALAEIRRAV